MDRQKLSFILYVTSSLALVYAALLNSPIQFPGKSWENTTTPAVFFGIVAIMILHVVFTGKALSQENFRKVNIVSGCMYIFAILIAIPGVTLYLALLLRTIASYF